MMVTRFTATLLACALATAPAAAGDGAPYVPSPHSIVAEMLELADVGPQDYLIDLGSGDGRIVLTAAKVFGARGLGVEIREDLVESARQAAVAQRVDERARFVQQDLFETDISGATVITMYLLPETVNELRDKLLWELDPGTRVLSHDYPIESWPAEQVVQLEHEAKREVTGVTRTNLYLYRVPADVAGRWRASVPGELAGGAVEIEFVQALTAVRGRAWLGDRLVALEEVALSGTQLTFVLPELDARFTGKVSNDTIEGTVDVAGQLSPWQAGRGEDS